MGLTQQLAQCDYTNFYNPQHVAEVAAQCTNHMKNTENDMKTLANCTTENQPELSDRMRAILVSWLIEVHIKFQLQTETLYITVNLIDRYCSQCQVPRRDYQLLGVTSMLIACKYEEIYVPKIEDFVDITDNTYTKQQILNQECQILK